VDQHTVQVVDPTNWSAGQADDDVSLVHACTLGGAVRFNRHDWHAAVFDESVRPCQPSLHAHVLGGYADPATTDATVTDESTGDELGRIDRHGATSCSHTSSLTTVGATRSTAPVTACEYASSNCSLSERREEK
jgi:hypothetical protein